MGQCLSTCLSFVRGRARMVRGVRVLSDAGGIRPVIDVQRVDYIRIPVTDMEKANQFYGGVLGLERNPNSPADDWVEYEAGNVTLAVMTPHTHDYEFAPLPVGTLALRVPDVADAKAKLEAAGVQVNEMWDSGVCHGAGIRDPAGNPILLHHRYAPYGPSSGRRSLPVAGKQLYEIPVRVSDERDPQSRLRRVAGRPDRAAARLHRTRVGIVEVTDYPGCVGDAGA